MSYPLQYFRLGIGNTDNNIISTDSSLSPSPLTGKPNEKWCLKYQSDTLFQIINSANNQILTSNENEVFLSENKDAPSQNWSIIGVQKDCEGNYLYYKILNQGDPSKALTYTVKSGFHLTYYGAINYQKFKINLDGLEGFAANCKTLSGEKTGVIGGLFGRVVMVETADQLEKELNSEITETIVINGNIDMKNKKKTRIRDNKTIVGSFKYHAIYDAEFITNSDDGDINDYPSDNIIITNIDFEVRNVPNRIALNIVSSRQIWIDHVNFNNSLEYNRTGNGEDEVGKYILITSLNENDVDKKNIYRCPDYITISYSKFTNRFRTIESETQNDDSTRNRTTLLYNWWNQNVKNQKIGNGKMHILNNYYLAFGQRNNGSETGGIIGIEGSEIVSQNNMFNGFSKAQTIIVENDLIRDDKSYYSTFVNEEITELSYSKKSSSWNPNESNYGYILLDACNEDETDIKAFCTKYAGCFNAQSGIKFINDSDFSDWKKTIYESPFLCHIVFRGNEDMELNLQQNLGKNKKYSEMKVVQTKIYKSDDCVHTVVFVK